MRFLAHSLKGSVATLGAGRMAELCGRIERLSADDLSAGRGLLLELHREFDRVCVAVHAELHGPAREEI